MIFTRTDIEKAEAVNLAPYAVKSSESKGRDIPEPESDFRTCFQRDTDRIVHSKAFRRLEYKTQVFVNYEGDHYRTRLTHTFEVARVAESIGRALGLNVELIEAISLAHDLGHTPFGHAGEEVLNLLTQNIGGFEHNRQSLRVVEKLERQYPGFVGLNLTWEVREGLLKHASIYDQPVVNRFEPDRPASLEAQVVNLADELAYNCHDIEDGLRSGVLKWSALKEIPVFGCVSADLDRQEQDDRINRHQAVRLLKDLLVNDAVTTSAARLEEFKVKTPEDARTFAGNIIQFSSDGQKQLLELSRFLLRNFYFNHRLVRMTTKAKWLLKNLFNLYVENPKLLPEKIQVSEPGEESQLRRICDYVAGMTDRFALDEYRKLADPSTGFECY